MSTRGKRLRRALCGLLALAALLQFAPVAAYAETPYEVVIETVTFGAEYPDIPAVEEAIAAITVPAIDARVRIRNVGIAQHERRIPQMIHTREKVDLVMVGLTLPLAQMVAEGMLLPLDGLLADCGGDITALFGEQLEAGRVNGTLYAIPADAYTAQAGGFVYNKQMADELGITVPDPLTAEALEGIFETIRAELPGVYGTALGGGGFSGFVCLHNLETYGSNSYAHGVTFREYESTRIVNLYATEPFRQYALRHRDWAERGFTLPGAMTSGIRAQEYMASGEIFGMLTACSPIEIPAQQGNYPFPIGMARITKPVRSTDGIQNRMWGIPVTCENPRRAMELLNLIFANGELANLLSNGIEGRSYKLAGEGVITYADGVDPASPGYASVFSRFGDQMDVYPWLPATSDFHAELAAFNEGALDSLTLGYTFDSEPVAAEVAAVDEVVALYLPPLECGLAEDVDAALAEFNARLEEAGIDRVIAENQRQLDLWLAARQG